MPKISDISNHIEEKITLTEFFGEEAFLTIRKLNKYQFSLLLNRSRQGYSSHVYSKMADIGEGLTSEQYKEITDSITPEEADARLKTESEIDREYYSYSIKKDGHNFTDDNDVPVDLDGGKFFDTYSGLISPSGLTLNDFIINKIIMFNRRGLELGEPTG
jgi:hypothetical protein